MTGGVLDVAQRGSLVEGEGDEGVAKGVRVEFGKADLAAEPLDDAAGRPRTELQAGNLVVGRENARDLGDLGWSAVQTDAFHNGSSDQAGVESIR